MFLAVIDCCLPDYFNGTTEPLLGIPIQHDSTAKRILADLKTEYLQTDLVDFPELEHSVWPEFESELKIYLPDLVQFIEPDPENEQDSVYLYVVAKES